MMQMHALIQHDLLTIGVIGVWLVIFCETGLFVGFCLPGDSLLFTAGVLASQHIFSIHMLWIGSLIAAFLGYQVGLWFGARFGHWLHNKPDTWYFKQRYITKAQDFYKRYGMFAVIIGRFVPIVRTFVPVVAGVGKMPAKRFFIANLVGACLWVPLVTGAGYLLGQRFPQHRQPDRPNHYRYHCDLSCPSYDAFLKKIDKHRS